MCRNPGRGSRRRNIAAFAGRPYAEVAVDVIARFVGNSIAEADLARMVREAYGTFRHPAVAPLTQLGVNTFALELFHGPTLAFKDLAMQLLARLMDQVLAARGERRTIVVATSGDTGGAAVEAFRGREPGRSRRAVSARPHLRRATAHDDDGGRRQRQRHRHRRHLRRLPGDRERPVQPSRLSPTGCGSPASIRSTGRASWRRRSITSPPRWRSARRIAKWPSPCRPAISATSMRAMWRCAWACRSTGW